MDPISLILTALITGASAALNDTAGDAIKDAYKALKSGLGRIFKGGAKAEELLKDPAGNIDQLSSEIKRTGADKNQDILSNARQFIELAKAAGYETYSITAKNVGVVGPNAHVDNQNMS